jgi:hypothetical protein
MFAHFNDDPDGPLDVGPPGKNATTGPGNRYPGNG